LDQTHKKFIIFVTGGTTTVISQLTHRSPRGGVPQENETNFSEAHLTSETGTENGMQGDGRFNEKNVNEDVQQKGVESTGCRGERKKECVETTWHEKRFVHRQEAKSKTSFRGAKGA